MTTVLSDHMMMQSDSMRTGTEGMVKQSDGTMTQSDASESGSECGPSDHQPLELSDEQKLATSCADLKIGDRVRIHGLKAAHLNDLVATVDKFVEAGAAAGRWDVKIPDGRIKAIKAEHLEILPESELGHDCGGATDADVAMEEKASSESHDEDSAMPQSDGTMTQSDTAEPGPGCGLPDHQSFRLSDEKQLATIGADLKVGDRVRIHGLKAADLNNLLATVEEFVEAGAAAGRWDVKIPDGSIKAIKPENLVLVVEAELGHNCEGDADPDVAVEEEAPSELLDEERQQVESVLSDGQLLEPLEQPELLEECKQTIALDIPQIEFSRLNTPFLGSLSARDDTNAGLALQENFCDASTPVPSFNVTKLSSFSDLCTPEKGRTASSMAASLCEGNSTPRSVSPRVISALGGAWTEDSACAVCGLELGKRKLRPRHHCRICWGSVCADCSPSSVQLGDEKVLQRVCNPCVLNVQVGPVLRERLDDLCEQLTIIGSSHSPLDGKADTLEDAVRKCESTLPGLDRESDDHRRNKEELQEMKTMCAAAETHATEAEIQLKQLSEELRVVKAQLQEAKAGSEPVESSQSRVRQQTIGIDGLLF